MTRAVEDAQSRLDALVRERMTYPRAEYQDLLAAHILAVEDERFRACLANGWLDPVPFPF